MTANGFSSYERFIKGHRFLACFTIYNAFFMKTNFSISRRLGAVYRGFSALTSVDSCSSYFMKTRPGPKTRAQGLGPGPGPEPTGRRKLLKILNIEKTRSAILCKKTCLTAPHHFSQTYLWRKRWFSKAFFRCSMHLLKMRVLLFGSEI